MDISDKYENLEDDFDRLIDAMVPFPSLDVDQFEQVRSHAMERRELMSQLSFLPASEFMSLIHQEDDKSNLDRDVARLLQSHELLQVRISGDWYFPMVQVNPDTNILYPELQLVAERARSQGYTNWEILSWLVRSNSLVDSTPGELPIFESGKVTPQTLVNAIKAKRDKSVLEISVAPIVVLRQGDVGQFLQRVNDWLSPSV